MRIIELKEKEVLEDRINFIAECNDYDDNGFFIGQQSRTKFAMFEDNGNLTQKEYGYEIIYGSLSWSNQEISDLIKNDKYKIYF